MTRLLLALVCTLGLASVTAADWTPVGGGYYQNASGDYATAKNVYFGWYYDCYGRYIPRYYYTDYVPASTPVSSLSPKSTDSEWIDFLKSREKISGAVALNESQNKAFLAKLAAIGVTPPFPAIEGSYGGGDFNFRKAGYLPPSQGNTAYAYGLPYTIRQEADLYLPVDPNAAIQALALAGKWSLDASREANQAVAGATGQILQSNERIALAREDRIRQVEILKATQPPSRITTTVTGVNPGVAPIAPSPPAFAPPAAVVDDGQTRVLKSETAKTQCASCHSGGSPKGGFDITKPLTAGQHLSIINRVSLPANAKGHMPPADGGQAVQMSAAQIADLLPKADNAAPPPMPKPEALPKPKPEAKSEPKPE